MADPLIPNLVVVNGEPTTVDVDPNSPLQAIVPQALAASGNPGQPADDWELRDADGYLLDPDERIGSVGWPAEVRLTLTRKADMGD